ncbi:unnamed protein product, partial [Prorocentrum cordatum]
MGEARVRANTIAHSALIGVAAKGQRWALASCLLARMLREGPRPNEISCVAALGATEAAGQACAALAAALAMRRCAVRRLGRGHAGGEAVSEEPVVCALEELIGLPRVSSHEVRILQRRVHSPVVRGLAAAGGGAGAAGGSALLRAVTGLGALGVREALGRLALGAAGAPAAVAVARAAAPRRR